jgi:hypothetical protein
MPALPAEVSGQEEGDHDRLPGGDARLDLLAKRAGRLVHESVGSDHLLAALAGAGDAEVHTIGED